MAATLYPKLDFLHLRQIPDLLDPLRIIPNAEAVGKYGTMSFCSSIGSVRVMTGPRTGGSVVNAGQKQAERQTVRSAEDAERLFGCSGL